MSFPGSNSHHLSGRKPFYSVGCEDVFSRIRTTVCLPWPWSFCNLELAVCCWKSHPVSRAVMWALLQAADKITNSAAKGWELAGSLWLPNKHKSVSVCCNKKIIPWMVFFSACFSPFTSFLRLREISLHKSREESAGPNTTTDNSLENCHKRRHP